MEVVEVACSMGSRGMDKAVSGVVAAVVAVVVVGKVLVVAGVGVAACIGTSYVTISSTKPFLAPSMSY